MHKYHQWPGFLLGGLFCLILGSGVIWSVIGDGGLWVVIFIGTPILVAVGILLFMGLLTVRLEPSGIRESIGPLTLKRMPANKIHTVVRHFIPGRVPIIVLAFSSLSPKELEMRGEARLRRDPKYRHTLKFREGKPDWGDLCLGCGFRLKGMLFIEYSEERKELIHSLYPHAEYRETKRMEDPIQAKNERSM